VRTQEALPPLAEYYCQHCGRFLLEYRGKLPSYMRVPCPHCPNDSIHFGDGRVKKEVSAAAPQPA
jgi:ribosomal protein S27E